MFPEEVSVAVALGGEEERAVGALEGLLTSVCEDVPAERAAPGELAEAVRTGDSIGGQTVG